LPTSARIVKTSEYLPSSRCAIHLVEVVTWPKGRGVEISRIVCEFLLEHVLILCDLFHELLHDECAGARLHSSSILGLCQQSLPR
jgi:hypothetical protein